MTDAIDAHVHVWERSTDPQAWIDPDSMGAIDRDFTVSDLGDMLRDVGVGRAVVVQSSNSAGETRRLLAADPEAVTGVVGWIDLTDDADVAISHALAGAKTRLVGIRHLAHIDPDPTWLLRPDVGTGLEALARHRLVFDLVIRWWQLPQATSIARTHPDTTFVLDHLGGPPLGTEHMAEWASQINRLGGCPNVTAKVSGLPSALGTDSWTTADLREPFDAALDAFGPARLMYGSDWPLVRLGGGPSRWHDAFDELVRPLSDEEQRLMRGECATLTYGLEESK